MSKHIFWIASYPKSGNTLVRALITSLFFTDDGVFDFTSWVYDDTQDTLFKKFQYFIERGVDPLFIIKTLKAKSDGMWHPRRKELRNANFITQ